MKKLTQKQTAFIEFYKKHGNGSKAARLAGYSHRSAANIAYENMRKPHVRAPIDEYLKSERERYDREWQRRIAAQRESHARHISKIFK